MLEQIANDLADHWLSVMSEVSWEDANKSITRRFPAPCGETTQLSEQNILFDVSDSWEWVEESAAEIRLTVKVFRAGGSETLATRKRVITRRGIRMEAASSLDGKKRWAVVQRPDGFFVYSEETFLTEDETQFGGGIYDYWSPTHVSGLFDTLESAKADAMGQFPWLRDAARSG